MSCCDDVCLGLQWVAVSPPPKMPIPVGVSDPYLIGLQITIAHSSHHSKRHLDRFSRFCTRPVHQTDRQSDRAVDNFTKTLDDKSQTDAIFLNFPKAFDKFTHQRLLLKVANYGITLQVLLGLRRISTFLIWELILTTCQHAFPVILLRWDYLQTIQSL